MSTDRASLSQHPAPHRNRVASFEAAFGLLGGPVAWFVQLCAGYGMSSWPCFPKDLHRLHPISGYEWTWAATGLVSLASVVVAVAAALVSQSTLRRTRDEAKGGHSHLLETGSGRTRFLALWGLIGGWAFAGASAFTAVAFFILPRCAG
jgi:hypothetical protein